MTLQRFVVALCLLQRVTSCHKHNKGIVSVHQREREAKVQREAMVRVAAQRTSLHHAAVFAWVTVSLQPRFEVRCSINACTVQHTDVR